jgi:uncharacterized membrane protein
MTLSKLMILILYVYIKCIEWRATALSSNVSHLRFSTLRYGLRMNNLIEECSNDIDIEPKDDNGISADHESENNSSFISVETSMTLPFCANTAFSAFSDLPRQPSWSHWLHSVSYIYPSDSTNTKIPCTECGIPLLETKWIMKWKKLSFTWKSKITKIQRPYLIQWESTSGLKNKGKIVFIDLENSTATDDKALVSLTLSFVTPRIVGKLLRRSDIISDFMQRKILLPTLENFRDVVSQESKSMND